jgi:hypothetical protein
MQFTVSEEELEVMEWKAIRHQHMIAANGQEYLLTRGIDGQGYLYAVEYNGEKFTFHYCGKVSKQVDERAGWSLLYMNSKTEEDKPE